MISPTYNFLTSAATFSGSLKLSIKQVTYFKRSNGSSILTIAHAWILLPKHSAGPCWHSNSNLASSISVVYVGKQTKIFSYRTVLRVIIDRFYFGLLLHVRKVSTLQLESCSLTCIRVINVLRKSYENPGTALHNKR